MRRALERGIATTSSSLLIANVNRRLERERGLRRLPVALTSNSFNWTLTRSVTRRKTHETNFYRGIQEQIRQAPQTRACVRIRARVRMFERAREFEDEREEGALMQSFSLK